MALWDSFCVDGLNFDGFLISLKKMIEENGGHLNRIGNRKEWLNIL